MEFDARRVAVCAGIFLSLVSTLGWPSLSLRSGASQALSSLLGSALESIEFGYAGHARLRAVPVSEVRRAGENVSSDAQLDLTATGRAGKLSFGVNLRRDVYLPLVIFFSAVCAAPVRRSRRVIALLLGLPIVFYSCLSALYGTICWLFAHSAPQVYPLTSVQLTRLDTLVSMFLMPPTLRFFVPLLLAVGTLSALGGAFAGSATRRDSAALALPGDRKASREQQPE